MLDEIDRHALFHEMHRSIEESATAAVAQLMAGVPELSYPPNYGFLPDEIAALTSIPKTSAMERALRKLIADGAAYPLFHLMNLADGVVGVPQVGNVLDRDRTAVDIALHDGFYESYWAWRRRRPNPGWRLDTYEGD